MCGRRTEKKSVCVWWQNKPLSRSGSEHARVDKDEQQQDVCYQRQFAGNRVLLVQAKAHSGEEANKHTRMTAKKKVASADLN